MENMRWRFSIECALAVASSVAFVVAVLWPQWIEGLFEVSPDGGSGELEWMIAIALAVLAAGFSYVARSEYKTARAR